MAVARAAQHGVRTSMNLSITRRPHESLSAYRFRYAAFCFRVAAFFSVFFILLAYLESTTPSALNPMVAAYCFFGIYIGLGMSIIGGFGFLIGGGWAVMLNENQRLKFSALLGAAICFPISIFCLYWAIKGLVSGTTLWAWISRPLYVHREVEPLRFWYSEAFLFWAGLYLPYATVIWLKKTFSSNSSIQRTRNARR